MAELRSHGAAHSSSGSSLASFNSSADTSPPMSQFQDATAFASDWPSRRSYGNLVAEVNQMDYTCVGVFNVPRTNLMKGGCLGFYEKYRGFEDVDFFREQDGAVIKFTSHFAAVQYLKDLRRILPNTQYHAMHDEYALRPYMTVFSRTQYDRLDEFSGATFKDRAAIADGGAYTVLVEAQLAEVPHMGRPKPADKSEIIAVVERIARSHAVPRSIIEMDNQTTSTIMLRIDLDDIQAEANWVWEASQDPHATVRMRVSTGMQVKLWVHAFHPTLLHPPCPLAQGLTLFNEEASDAFMAFRRRYWDLDRATSTLQSANVNTSFQFGPRGSTWAEYPMLVGAPLLCVDRLGSPSFNTDSRNPRLGNARSYFEAAFMRSMCPPIGCSYPCYKSDDPLPPFHGFAALPVGLQSDRYYPSAPSFRNTWSYSPGYHFQNWPLRPNFRDRKDQHQFIFKDRIISGEDVRTTVMLRNIPPRVSHVDLRALIEEALPGQYDFIYLRIDFENEQGVGYAFINLIGPASVLLFCTIFNGFRWKNSNKISEVSYATIQGRETLIQKFRNSCVMLEPPRCRPRLYLPAPSPNAGQEESFPPPDNLQKLERSKANAVMLGLYDAKDRNKMGAHRRGGNWDRGTSMEQMERQGYVSPGGVRYNASTSGSMASQGWMAPAHGHGRGMRMNTNVRQQPNARLRDHSYGRSMTNAYAGQQPNHLHLQGDGYHISRI